MSSSSPNRTTLPKVLVVDDDEQILKQIRWALSDEYSVLAASDREGALKAFHAERTPVVLLDLGLPPRPRDASEGLLALEAMLSENPLAKVIIVSGNSERQNAVLAIEKGAFDIFPKPVDIDELRVVLHRAYRRIDLERAGSVERAEPASSTLESLVAESPRMVEVLRTVAKVASAEVSVLISGDSGTGKECVARALHEQGGRHSGPFVAINCGAIPESLLESELFGHEKGAFTGATSRNRGKLEYAQGGTLFLDEIGELAPAVQVKLLRFLQEKVLERVGGRQPIPVDARVLAATNRDLKADVGAGRFREDLYFRLAVVEIHLPPLKERGEDVHALAEHFLALYSDELRKPRRKLSRAALEALRRHDWPGNVRELQNRMRRAVVLCETPMVEPGDLELAEQPVSGQAKNASSLKAAKESLERELVSGALEQYGWNISKTARELGISRPTLYDLIGRYGLKEEN